MATLYSASRPLKRISTLRAGPTYLPDADYNGSDAFTLTVHDNGNSGSGEHPMSVTVSPSASNPSTTRPPSPKARMSPSMKTRRANADQLGQRADARRRCGRKADRRMTFHITANSTPVVQRQPQISSSGTLTFTPADNANGSASLSVTLQDKAAEPIQAWGSPSISRQRGQ
jgi:hypothetical protein